MSEDMIPRSLATRIEYTYSQKIEALLEDNKRLREALEHIKDCQGINGDCARAWAKDALHQAQGEDKGGVK